MRFWNPFHPPPAPPAFGAGKVLPEAAAPYVDIGPAFVTYGLHLADFFRSLSFNGLVHFLTWVSRGPWKKMVRTPVLDLSVAS